MTLTWFSALCCGLMAALPTRVEVRVRGSLEASLKAAAPAQGAALAAEVARLLRWRGDVNHNVDPGDKVRLLYTAGATEPDLLALDYDGGRLRLRAFQYKEGELAGRFYDTDGVLVEPQLVNAPVPDYVQITDVVQHGRGKRPHNGIDLKAPEGSAVVFPFASRVLRTNWSRRVNGHCVEVVYPDGTKGRFLHLLRLAPGVAPGASFTAGAPVGWVGSTGHSNAPHLHYEILRGKKPLQPLSVHGQRQARLGPKDMARFVADRDALLRSLLGPAFEARLPLR